MEQNRKAMLAYILPFAVWMGLMFSLPTDAPSYAIRSAATLAVGIACFVLGRRIAPPAASRFRLSALALGLLAGAAVCAFWIALPAWPFPEPTAPDPSPYAPRGVLPVVPLPLAHPPRLPLRAARPVRPLGLSLDGSPLHA